MEAGYDKVAEVGEKPRQTLLEISLDLQLVVYWVPCSDKPIGPGTFKDLIADFELQSLGILENPVDGKDSFSPPGLVGML